MRALAASLLLLLLPGCFRLSDPFYTFMPLKADDPPGPEYSLLVGTIEVDGGFLSPSSVDTITFRQLEPGGSRSYRIMSESRLFRAFQRRNMRDGTFVIALPPGAYELEALEETRFPFPARWRMSEGGRVQSRFYVTRPGVYDLGVLRVGREGWGNYTISRVPPRDEAARREVLDKALEGTGWEKLLEQTPTSPRKPKPGTQLVEWMPEARG